MLFFVGLIGTGVYSRQDTSEKPSGGEHLAAQSDKSKSPAPFRRGERDSKGGPQTPGQGQDAESHAAKEELRLANKWLQEEIEDEKVKLEGLQKKLERLKSSGIKLAPVDPDLRRPSAAAAKKCPRLSQCWVLSTSTSAVARKLRPRRPGKDRERLPASQDPSSRRRSVRQGRAGCRASPGSGDEVLVDGPSVSEMVA